VAFGYAVVYGVILAYAAWLGARVRRARKRLRELQ
jgi:CcmD family protein